MSDGGAHLVVRACTRSDDADWLALRKELWDDCPHDEQLAEMEQLARQPERYGQFVALLGERGIGLAEAAIRTDHVNGATTSPVGFLEGIWVDPEHRRRGVAAELVAAVEAWTRERGCVELASDAAPENAASHAMHRALGFAETERAVFFCKRLQG